MVCPVSPDLMDYDYQYILYTFNMNYTAESMRNAYLKAQKKQEETVSNDMLRELGYNESDILNREE